MISNLHLGLIHFQFNVRFDFILFQSQFSRRYHVHHVYRVCRPRRACADAEGEAQDDVQGSARRALARAARAARERVRHERAEPLAMAGDLPCFK